jgi:diacylglycerol kinase family enzyme
MQGFGMPAANLRIRAFADYLGKICPHALLAPGKSLRWLLVINPKAGGFTIGSRWKRHRAVLEDYAERARANPARRDCLPVSLPGPPAGAGPGAAPAGTAAASAADTGSGAAAPPLSPGVLLTGGPGDAEAAATSLLDRAAGGNDFFLIITAGGDGTSREVQSALYHGPAETRDRFAILRLPMGTGNDGADAAELDGALDLLINPVNIVKDRALRLLTATPGKGPFLAFNILSVGLDAFVTHMTNKMKGKLPGDSYKLWVDIAALLYDRIYTVGPLDLRALDEGGGEAARFCQKILLLAVGASGRRTYGSHKKILPDDRNVCALKQMSLFRKLALKELFNYGTHIDKSEAILFNAVRVEFSGLYPLLAQMDGETVLLQKEDFPAAIELSPPVIPALKLK